MLSEALRPSSRVGPAPAEQLMRLRLRSRAQQRHPGRERPPDTAWVSLRPCPATRRLRCGEARAGKAVLVRCVPAAAPAVDHAYTHTLIWVGVLRCTALRVGVCRIARM